MQATVSELAKKYEVLPGHVMRVAADLGLEVEGGQFEADSDTMELVETGLLDYTGSKTVPLTPDRTPRDVAQALGVADKQIQMTLVTKLKVMATLTTTLQQEVAEKLAKELGYEVEWYVPSAPKKKEAEASASSEDGQIRPPVVTILGHVDHGKTSLLDYIRKTSVVSGEHGGITQHIGAYQVNLPEGTITFLDTPGHAAFTAMRARGAQVTDIAILVVAADDGIMPQTIEAINHVKSAGVPIIVAVNKIDKPAANPDKVLQQLTEHELVPEAFGGDVITANVSAMTGEGVDNLLEMILLQAEVMQLKGDPDADVEAVVVEAELEKGRGPVATLLVKQGTVEVGDIVVVGSTWGKIKAMTDYTGARMKEAGPSMPVEVLGLNEVPAAGDKVETADSEREARELVQSRIDATRLQQLSGPKKRVTLRDLKKSLAGTDIKTLNLIVKADVHGSVEAVRGLLEDLDIEGVDVKILHSGVGPVTESDILLASASDAICVGFNVKPEPRAKTEAARIKVEIRTYTIIYELIEDIEAAVTGMLEPKYEEEYHATVEVRAVFKLTKSGKVAGCHVTDGKILRNDKVRVRRGNELVFEGELDSLKNVKQDSREMIAGQDCGIKFEGWEDFAVGDVIEAYDMIQVNA